MNRIDLIAIDLDGTLLRPDRTISPAVREAVRRASRRARVVIATARPPRSMRSFVHELGLRGPQVVYNGAATWDCDANAATAHVSIEPGVLGEMIAATRERLPHSVVNLECLDRWYTDRTSDRYVTETGRMFQPDRIAPLGEFADVAVTKLMLHAEPAEIDALRPVLESIVGARALLLRTDPDLLQAVDPAAGKWAAILALAMAQGVTADAVMTIGDNENDVEMLTRAGVGVCVANGTAAAKAAADWVAPSNRDDGMAAALDRFVNGTTSS